VSAYMLCSPTECVPLDKCSKVFLRRSLPQEKDVYVDFSNCAILENMEVCICVNTYRLFFLPHTEDFWAKDINCWAPVPKSTRENRRKSWRKKLGTLGWMRDAKPEQVEAKQREWESLLRGSNGEKQRSAETEDTEDPIGTDKASGGSAQESVFDRA